MGIHPFFRSRQQPACCRASRRASHGARVLLRLEALEDRTVPSIVSENALPGTPQSTWDTDHNDDPSIRGYAAGFSVDHGQNITFKIDTPYNTGQTGTIPYQIQIYRFGYYRGDGARLVDNTIPEQHGTPQPNPVIDHSTGLVDAGNWRDSYTWHIPAAATSGVYFARIIRDDGTLGTDGRAASNFIFFVVRDDGGHSDILLKTSDATWNAYNYWGGASLYYVDRSVFPPTELPYDRGYEVSYNRPLTNVFNGGVPYSGQLTPQSNDFANTFFHAEFPLVAWVEANGYDVSYVSDLDMQRTPNLVLNHKIFIGSGHDEYWSENERDGVERARAAGVNLSFQDGNEVYWRTLYQPGIGGSASDPRTMLCFKESYNPSLYNPARGFTGLWDDEVNYSLPNRPTNALTGEDYVAQFNPPANILVPPEDATDRFWRNTSIANLRSGDAPAAIQGVIGFEWDESPDNGLQPGGLFDLSHTVYTGFVDYSTHPPPLTHTLTLYRDPHSHALIFGAGSILFNWALDNHHDALMYGSTIQQLNYHAPVDPRMQQAMVNLFADMSDVQPHSLRPGLERATESTDRTPPTSRITSPAANAQIQTGQAITIQGTASDSDGKVAGVEVSVDNGTTWHSASGHANWTFSWTAPSSTGTVTLRTRAVDDSGNLETPSAGIHLQIVQPTTTALTSSRNPSTQGEAVSFTAVVTSAGQPVTSGQVTFKSGSTVLGTVALNSSGHAVFQTNTLSVGSHTISATFNGNNVDGVSNASITQMVAQPAPGVATSLVLTRTTTSEGDSAITVTVVDAFGNTVRNYQGTVSLSSNDPEAAQLGHHTFTADDHGVFTFPVHPFSQRRTRVTATAGDLTGFLDVVNDD